MNNREQPPVLLEVAAALLVPSAAYGFTRVFVDLGDVTPIVGTALLSTAVAVLLRRLRVPLAMAAIASTAFLAILIINRFAEGTATVGIIPTGATRDALAGLVDELVLNFQELKTPVPALDPFLAAAMIGAWVMAFLTDWGALRLRLAFEPVLPAGLLFVFSSVLGAGTNQILVTVLFATTVAFWAVTQRTVNLTESSTWLANDRTRGATSLAQTGAMFAVLALLAGVVLGPRLPGASAEEIISFPDSGDPTRQVISPYVSLTAQLAEQTDVELFRVAADQPSYWRLVGLDEYDPDQKIFKVAGNFSQEDGRLPGVGDLGGVRDDVRQDFSVTALDAIWLPAAFAPTEILESGADITWNAETSSLTVANGIPDSNGISYSLQSSIPRYTAAELSSASDLVPPEIAERYLQLPGLPPIVGTEAARVTAGATTRYEKMLALETYFRNFDYSLELSPRQGDPIEQFLNERVGFCQQFSATFALMARELGIPARVAVGTTWGDPVDTDDEGRTIYRVTGRQAHAWPEVWFADLGWVAFEPTPGRGSPDAQGYSTARPLQDSNVQPDDPEGPVTTTTQAPSQAAPLDVEPQLPEADLVTPGDGTSSSADGGVALPVGTILKTLAVLAVLAAYLGGLPLYHQLRRQRRRMLARTPVAEVETAWAEAVEALELGYGLIREPAETRTEFADRLVRDRRVPPQAIDGLAHIATVARYYPRGLTPAAAADATRFAGEIEQSVNQRVSAFNRWKRLIDPRRIWKPTARATVAPLSDEELASPAPQLLPPPGDASQNGHRRSELV